MNERKSLMKSRQSSALPHPKNCRLMLGCPEGKRSPRYHRKRTKDRAKKTSEAGKTLSSSARGKLHIKGQIILSKNKRPEMIGKNGRFQAKMGGLKSLPWPITTETDSSVNQLELKANTL